MRHSIRLSRILLGILALAAAGCATERRPAAEEVEVRTQAVWTNGDFEADAIGATPPTGWVTATRLNPAITDTRPSPQTLPSLNLAAGGALMTAVVGGATESQQDPDVLTKGTLRFREVRTARRTTECASRPDAGLAEVVLSGDCVSSATPRRLQRSRSGSG